MAKKIDLEQNPFETQAQYYKRLAKAADRRLRDLEDLSKNPKYQHVLDWAYRNAMYDLRYLYGDKRTRFDVKLPETKLSAIDQKRYMARINAVKRFLEAPSSLKSSIDEVYDKRANTLNERYGTDYNWQTVGKIFESGIHSRISKLFESKTAVRVIAKLQKRGVDIKKAAKSYDLRKIRNDKAKVEAKAKFMSEYGLTLDDLIE